MKPTQRDVDDYYCYYFVKHIFYISIFIGEVGRHCSQTAAGVESSRSPGCSRPGLSICKHFLCSGLDVDIDLNLELKLAC